LRKCGIAATLLACLLPAATIRADEPRPFEIRFVDAETGRGVPLVELKTVHHVPYVTDSAGRVAYDEPGRAGETMFFGVHAHGYRAPKDGFGIEGVRCKIEPGGKQEFELERINVAERLYRVTGQDIYRDSLLLGHDVPIPEKSRSGMVAGQDSVFGVPYRDRLYWFWGDTARLSYPLGLFRMAGATSPLPSESGLSSDDGVRLDYFVNEEGFARAMSELPDPKGVIWIDGVCVLPDESGRDRLVGHHSRREGLGEQYEHGTSVYDDTREIFTKATDLPLDETWRHLSAHPVRFEERGEKYVGSGLCFPVTRTKATLAAALDPETFESFSCLPVDADPKTAAPRRNADGKLDWRWQAGPPVTPEIEARFLKEGVVQPEELRFLPEDAANPGKRIEFHAGTVNWNPYRKRWVAIASQIARSGDAPSLLGETWYSEAPSPQGPFEKAVKIVTHDKQSFYNPCHHAFFDADEGRTIYFEGTYTNSFTAAAATPRYEYNQIMYRLNLDASALTNAFPR
jgi:hypothetical protein